MKVKELIELLDNFKLGDFEVVIQDGECWEDNTTEYRDIISVWVEDGMIFLRERREETE